MLLGHIYCSFFPWGITTLLVCHTVLSSHLICPFTTRGTTEDLKTSFLHFSLFSIALWDWVNSWPVYSLMLSSHLFFCLPCLLPPFSVPCKMVLARPNEQETCPDHFILSLYDRQAVFVWSDCLLDLGTDFLVGNMVFV